jgi:AraC-like DNA-binding protein
MNTGKITLEHISSVISLVVGLLYILQTGFINKGNKKTNRYFFYYLINLNFIILFFFLIDVGLTHVVKYLVPLITSSILLVSPFLWIYIKKLVYPTKNESLKKHFLPSIIIGSSLLLLQSSLFIIHHKPFQETIIQVMSFIAIGAISFLFLIQSIYYSYLSYKLYKAHQQNLENLFSYSENIDLKWIRVLLVGYIIFIVSMVIVNMMKGEISDILFDTLMTVYIIYIGINALKQKEIYATENLIKIDNNKSEIITENSLINEEQTTNDTEIEDQKPELFSKLKTELLKKVNEDKIFREQDLSIYMLAKEIGTNSKYLSTIINKEFGKNFVNFINELRIEEAKHNLKSEKYKNYTIEAHGQHVGFKSKSSFNIAFKKYTGKTPSEFLKN